MPLAPVDDEGATFYYEDSGAPPDSTDYTTIVLVHGLVFHGAIFRKVLPYAYRHNLRIVTVNLHDYPKSSLYSENELSALVSTPQPALQALSHHFAAFLEYFVKTYEIPEIQVVDGETTSGIVLMTWSFSSMFHVALLGSAQKLSKETKVLLNKYWRRSIIYEPAVINLGIPVPEGAYSPLYDFSLSFEERMKAFAIWVSSYFPAVTPDALPSYTVQDLISRQDTHTTPTFLDTLPEEWMKLSTSQRITPEEFKEIADPPAMARGGVLAFKSVPHAVHKEHTLKALWEPELDPDAEGEEVVLPNLSVLVLWNDMSMGHCLWSAKVLYDQKLENDKKEKSRARDVKFARIEGVNHFAHWDAPQTFIQTLVEHL